MRYYGHRFEQLDPEREREYNEKHLADCLEVKTYKLTPEEIEARYVSCKGSGKYIDSLVDVRNLTTRKDDEDMAVIKPREEILEVVKKMMEEQNITEHAPGAKHISKHLKRYEVSIYEVFGGMQGLADELGMITLSEYNKRKNFESNTKLRKAKKPEPIVDIPAKEFGAIEPKSHYEVEYMTITSGDNVVRCPLLAEYQKKVDECMSLEVEIIGLWNQREDKQAELLKLENWLEGFEAAARLVGVSLE